ncbi:MAG: NAD(P)H-hydrate dehydratase [Lachnospiraceae bacterium]|nr:NAD(P)H-hydrate dehydratase [Lachnospiraceae bacterium]
MKFIDDTYIRETIFKRNADAHKGDFGKVLVYCGSPGMAGAAILCGKAALRSGSGLVRFLMTPSREEIKPILQTVVYEATIVREKSADLSEYDAIVCGCGLGETEEAVATLKKILTIYAGTLVLDADALNILAHQDDAAELLRSRKANLILTPHVGEAKQLLHTEDEIRSLEARVDAVCTLSEQYHCITVLKGAGTLIAQDGEIYENTTGNPGMATGGSGDVLAGVIASLAGQGYAPLDAARMGVFIHGKAGDLAAEELGEMSVIARDIIKKLPAAFKQYYQFTCTITY